MPTDISIHALGTPLQGNSPPAPEWPRLAGQASLADDTLSALFDITVPSVAILVSTAKVRVDCTPLADVGAIDPSTSPDVLLAELPVYRFLSPGSYHFKTLAYA